MFLPRNTRFDVTFALMQLAISMSKSTSAHNMVSVKHIVRYLRGNSDVNITYRREGNKELSGYSGSSYATEDPQRARSTSGTMFFLSGGLVHFSS